MISIPFHLVILSWILILLICWLNQSCSWRSLPLKSYLLVFTVEVCNIQAQDVLKKTLVWTSSTSSSYRLVPGGTTIGSYLHFFAFCRYNRMKKFII